MTEPRVVVLGGGPAGVGGAYRLRRNGRARVTLVERRDTVGGNAGSFEVDGHRVDYGSHRLHPACKPEILAEIRELLGGELVRRPRHGRIRLRGRWIHFPLRPLDLLLHTDAGFVSGVARDALSRLGGGSSNADSYEAELSARLGPTICCNFYFPYARKIWGREPGELSGEQARRRVAANSFTKLLRKVAGRFPGVKPVGFGHFYYPERGYGSISEAYAEAARDRGAELLLGWSAVEIVPPDGRGDPWRVAIERDGKRRVLEADHLWSTIPVTVAVRLMAGPIPGAVEEAARAMRYRAMLLVYLRLQVDRFSEYDAHYFPGEDVLPTRLSEPKNYAARTEPRGSTVLCAELPTETDSRWWAMGDEELGARVAKELAGVGLSLPHGPRGVVVKRLSHAYPIYLRGYERHFERLDAWARELPRFLTYGRQGLFAHDNTHHALAMAYAAADCFRNGEFDRTRWETYREEFDEHVVED